MCIRDRYHNRVLQHSFTSDVIHQSETVRHLGSIRKEEEEEVSNRTFYVCDLPGQNLIRLYIYALVTGAAAAKPPSLACRHLPFVFAFLPVVDA